MQGSIVEWKTPQQDVAKWLFLPRYSQLICWSFAGKHSRKKSDLSFHDLGLNKALLRTLEEIGHTEPTPIQSKAIPAVLEGKDVVGLAQTGTGKTAAFLLPLLQRLNNPDHKGKFRPIRTVVLTPTRELAAQIFEKVRIPAQ